MPPSDLLVDRVRTLLQSEPGLTEKKMFGGYCFLIHGHMVCGVTGKNDLMFRVGKDRYEESLKRPGARAMDFTGRPMKSMVFVDPNSTSDEEDLARWIECALDFVRTLPEK